ncbi:MAG TPA: cyclic nucleotide-binding domain-containing protein [Thermoanaerobaculia bacterium]
MRKVLILFGQLNDEDLEWLLRAGHTRSVPRGGIVIRQGDTIDALFILLEGKLSVWLGGKREREIARLNAGEVVGEMSFVDSRPPSATVKALEDATVFAVPRRDLARKLESDLGFAARFYRALAIYLATTVRERHRALGYGHDLAPDEAPEDDDELDAVVLDGVSAAGERFDRMVKRLLVA